MPERLTIREMAQRRGVSIDTIRRQIKRGELVTHREQRGKGSVLYAEMPDAEPIAAPQAVPTASVVEVETLRDYVTELKRQLEVREREVQELHVLLDRAQRALPGPKAMPTAGPMDTPMADAADVNEGPMQPWRVSTGQLWALLAAAVAAAASILGVLGLRASLGL
jgi:hypothetical protein